MLFYSGYCQEGRVKSADEKYERYIYIDAIKIYEKVAKKGYKDEKMLKRLGNAYYFNGQLSNAKKWYDELFKLNSEQDAEYFYRYAQTMKALRDYENADKMMNLFTVKSVNDLRAKLYAQNKEYLDEIKQKSSKYEVKNIDINSKYSDYGSALLGNTLIFATARDSTEKICKWTNQPFTNLYQCEIQKLGKTGPAEPFSKTINSKFHESTPVFTKDGKTVYFTRNNYLNKRSESSDNTTLLKLYKAELKKGKWKNIKELPFNSDEYSVAHPALSNDEKTLYFASDMPGTLGLSDLFSVKINDDGSFGIPVNLGKDINTEGRETFPFISKEGELYFATDGRPGLGGLDIFSTKITDNNQYEEVKNIGEPINSPQDDFAFIIDSTSTNGYFTSNRDGGKGYDDIYYFKVCKQIIMGTVTNRVTGEPISDAKVSLLDEEFNLLKVTIVGKTGKYDFNGDCSKIYYIRAEKDDYETKEEKVITENTSGIAEVPIALEPIEIQVEVGQDLAKILDITTIYFDLDKSFIRKDAAFELQKILAVMQDYPKMKIEVRSHTDSRQTHEYNEALSERRAKSTVNWLIKKGINPNRLTYKGYGETQLVNGCSDGVPCTEEEHQANRRSEFIILSLE